MLLEVKRTIKTPSFTIGELRIDGHLHYYTCEDMVRGGGDPKTVCDWKVPCESAIPVGKYKVIVDFSQRFQKHMPHLLDVPGFSGVRIHSGNVSADTEGCILIGLGMGKGCIVNSRAAFNDFMPKLNAAVLKGDVWLSIS